MWGLAGGLVDAVQAARHKLQARWEGGQLPNGDLFRHTFPLFAHAMPTRILHLWLGPSGRHPFEGRHAAWAGTRTHQAHWHWWVDAAAGLALRGNTACSKLFAARLPRAPLASPWHAARSPLNPLLPCPAGTLAPPCPMTRTLSQQFVSHVCTHTFPVCRHCADGRDAVASLLNSLQQPLRACIHICPGLQARCWRQRCAAAAGGAGWRRRWAACCEAAVRVAWGGGNTCCAFNFIHTSVLLHGGDEHSRSQCLRASALLPCLRIPTPDCPTHGLALPAQRRPRRAGAAFARRHRLHRRDRLRPAGARGGDGTCQQGVLCSRPALFRWYTLGETCVCPACRMLVCGRPQEGSTPDAASLLSKASINNIKHLPLLLPCRFLCRWSCRWMRQRCRC